jgi:hypothetical protein
MGRDCGGNKVLGCIRAIVDMSAYHFGNFSFIFSLLPIDEQKKDEQKKKATGLLSD